MRHIYDFFTFDVPSARFCKSFKSGRWNGKIHLLKKQRYLYIGLKTKLISFLQTNNYIYTDCTTSLSKVNSDKETISNILDTIKLPFELYDYQRQTILQLLTTDYGLLISPTSSGKTVIIFLIVALLLKLIKPKSIVIAVPTISLVQQTASDFISYCTTDKSLTYFNNNVHLLYGGCDKETTKPIIIGTYASLALLPVEFFNSVDVIIGDECHLLSKQYGQYIFENCNNTSFKMGCTGTLQDTVIDKMVLEGLFGAPFQFINTSQLIENKQVSQLTINPIILKYSSEFCNDIKTKTYMEEYDKIISSIDRLNILIDIIMSFNNNTLILFTKISKHGDIILNELKNRIIGTNKEIHYITGTTDIEIREASRLVAEKKNNLILLCSYGVFSQGISIKNLHNVILASPYKSKIKILQSIGRGLRLHDSKKVCNIYDIVDDCRIRNKKNDVTYINYLFTHFLERLKLYHQESFSINMQYHPKEINQ